VSGAIVELYQLWPLIQHHGRDPATRHLGAYRFVRHRSISPKRSDHWIIHTICICVDCPVIGTQIAFQLRRMHNEELVLAASFPEYDAYGEIRALGSRGLLSLACGAHSMVFRLGCQFHHQHNSNRYYFMIVRQFEKRSAIEQSNLYRGHC